MGRLTRLAGLSKEGFKGKGGQPSFQERATKVAYMLQFVFPSQPDAGTVVLLLDGAVEVGAHSGQAGRGFPGSALQPHLLEALRAGRGGEPLAPAFHLDMTRQSPRRTQRRHRAEKSREERRRARGWV